MDKKEYFKKSLQQGLPNRCPILSYCARRAWTIYFLNRYHETDSHKKFSDIMYKEGHIPKDFDEKVIEFQAENPGGMIGKDSGWFHDLCPEVHLFDTMNSWRYFQGTACTSGSYDKEMSNQSTIKEEKHFSECAEFSHYLFNHPSFSFLSNTKSQKKPKPHYTYLMFNNDNGLYKIGMSHTPKYREKTLQGEEPQVELVAMRKFSNRMYAQNFETELHLEYKEYRKRGEWFTLDEFQVKNIIEKLNEK